MVKNPLPLGGGVRQREFLLLSGLAYHRWTDNYKGSGVAGLVLTDKIDPSKELFFPAVGHCYNGNVVQMRELGAYWCSSLRECDPKIAYSFYFPCYGVGYVGFTHRYHGVPVRGVLG